MSSTRSLISVVVPVCNEEVTLGALHEQVSACFASLPYDLEVIFVDDGSTDGSLAVLDGIAAADSRVRVLTFTRNFGKEAALSAGIHACLGDACIMIDADLQHPVSLVPEFLARWEEGAEVVVGVREDASPGGVLKRIGSRLFYALMDRMSATLTPNATDFRLLDRNVVESFNLLGERMRMTRALVDWLGYHQATVTFRADERSGGPPAYSLRALVRLAVNGIVSLSLFPLRLAGYLGVVITPLAALATVALGLYTYVFDDPWGLGITGTAVVGLLIVFLTGIILTCLGLMSLYIGQIRAEVLGRPLYVLRTPRGAHPAPASPTADEP